MVINRHFTKVYERPRKPLSWKPFDQFLEGIDNVIISDVAFALTGKRPETVRTASEKRSVNTTKKKEIK